MPPIAALGDHRVAVGESLERVDLDAALVALLRLRLVLPDDFLLRRHLRDGCRRRCEAGDCRSGADGCRASCTCTRPPTRPCRRCRRSRRAPCPVRARDSRGASAAEQVPVNAEREAAGQSNALGTPGRVSIEWDYLHAVEGRFELRGGIGPDHRDERNLACQPGAEVRSALAVLGLKTFRLGAVQDRPEAPQFASRNRRLLVHDDARHGLCRASPHDARLLLVDARSPPPPRCAAPSR